jgi:hypothetical protein
MKIVQIFELGGILLELSLQLFRPGSLAVRPDPEWIWKLSYEIEVDSAALRVACRAM